MKHCEEWIKANKRDPKGVTQNQHFETLRKMGAPVPEINSTPVPKELNYLKIYWLQCRRDRVIQYSELFYFQQLMRIDFQPYEILLIMQIDNIYWNSNNGNNSNVNSKGGSRGG